jgi:hypothetical protein
MRTAAPQTPLSFFAFVISIVVMMVIAAAAA